MPSKIIPEELKEEIRDYYQSSPMTIRSVAEHFNLSDPTIIKILKDIPRWTRAQINSPNLDERFFQYINTEAKAYFLGLIISDGNVYDPEVSKEGAKGRQKSISITLDLNDEYMLNEFKKHVKSNTSVGHDGRGCGQIAVRSNKMAEDLAKWGVVPRKSFSTYLPEGISDDMMPHLFRGIFDGDGSIQMKQIEGRYLHAMSYCGTHRLMQDMCDYLNTHLNLENELHVYDYKNKELSEFKIQRINDILKFGEWMYRDATIFLTRKHDTYLEFKKHYSLDS